MPKKPIILVIILVLVMGGFFVGNQFKSTEVQGYKVQTGQVREVIEDTGKVSINEKQIIASNQGGKVVQLNVEVGQQVEEGQLLGWLSPRKSLLEQLEAVEKAYELAQAQAELVLETNPEFSQLKANLKETEINFAKAKRDYEQAQVLFKAGAISKEEFLDSEDNFYLWEQKLKAIENQVNNLQLASIKKKALLDLAQAQAELVTLQESLKDVELVALQGGTVTEIFVEEDEVALPGSKILELGNLDSKEIKAEILAAKIKDLVKGQQVEISGDMLNAGEIITGRISKIAPKAVLTHSLLGAEEYRVPMTISLDSQGPELIPGGEVDIKIIKEQRENILVIDEDAVFEIEGEDFVFVVANNKAQLRKVKVGLEGDEFVEVTDGLKANEIVIIEPPTELSDGTRVKVEF